MPIFLIKFHEGELPEVWDAQEMLSGSFSTRKELEPMLKSYSRSIFDSWLHPYVLYTVPCMSQWCRKCDYWYLYNNLGDIWESLCLSYIRFGLSKVTPTIFLYVKPSLIFDWSSLRSELLILTSCDPEIKISFCPGWNRKYQQLLGTSERWTKPEGRIERSS